MKSRSKREQREREAEQLSLPIEAIECRYYGDCAAPLCPRDVRFGTGMWFPSEPVCRLRHAPDWVQKQRRIARLPGINPERYFTFRMLKALPCVIRGLQGANPEHITAERIWFARHIGRRGKGRSSKVRPQRPPDGQLF